MAPGGTTRAADAAVATGAARAAAALFAPPPEGAAHPAVPPAARLAHDVLAPHAPAADDPERGVDPTHLQQLAGAGLFSVAVPAADGGLGGSARVDAETVELLSGACGATLFVVLQHRLPQLTA